MCARDTEIKHIKNVALKVYKNSLLLSIFVVAGNRRQLAADDCECLQNLCCGAATDFLLLFVFYVVAAVVYIFVPFSAVSKKSPHVIAHRFSGSVSELLATQFPQHFRRLLNFLCFVFFA